MWAPRRKSWDERHKPNDHLTSRNQKRALRKSTQVQQGCALRKIEGSPVLCTCEIQCAQHMISMKKLRFSSPPRTKVRCHGPPGSVRPQPCTSQTRKIRFLSISFKSLIMLPVFPKLLKFHNNVAQYLLQIYFLILYVLGFNLGNNLKVQVRTGHFWVPKTLTFKMRLSAKRIY